MAIPEQHRVPELEDIESAFRDSSLDVLTQVDGDTILSIGKFVVSYSFIELNVRRCIEFLWRADLLPDRFEQYPILRLPTFKLIEVAKTAVEAMDPSIEPVTDTLFKLHEIEYRRSIRNLFAHFAPCYFASHDAVIFLTRSESDAKQALGKPLDKDGVCYAIMKKRDIIGIQRHIVPYEEWIAIKASEWWERYLANAQNHPRS